MWLLNLSLMPAAFEHWPGRRVTPEESRKILSERLTNFFESGPPSGPVLALEIGCGEGSFSLNLWTLLSRSHTDAGTRLYALDLNMTSMAVTQRRFQKGAPENLRALCGDLYNLPVMKERFDYVFAFNVFYWADRGKLLQEARRVLKETGKIFTYDRVPTPINGLSPVFFFTLERSQIP